MQGDVEGLQGAVRPGAFQVVLGAEQPIAGGAPLAPCQGAQAVETARDGRSEPLLAVNVGRHRSKQRGDGLVGPVRSAQSLDGRVSPPARLHQIVDPALLVLDAEVRMVAAARAAGVGEHQHPLFSGHEGVRLGLGGRGAAPLDDAAAVALDHPAATAGDLSHQLGPQRGQHRVQHARHSGEAGEFGDKLLAQPQGLLADHGRAIDHHRDHGDIAVLVLDGVHRHDREGAHQVVEHLVLGRQVDGEVVPLLGGDLGEAAFHHRLIGRDDLHHGRSALAEVLPDRGHEGRGLQAGEEVTEEPQLGPLERRHDGGGRLARLWLAVLADADRLQGGAQVLVDQLVGVGPGVPDCDVVVRERMTQGFVFHAVERQRPGDVETHGLQLARDQLHHRHAAGLHGVHEGLTGGEGGFGPAPQAEPGGVGQVLRRGGARS